MSDERLTRSQLVRSAGRLGAGVALTGGLGRLLPEAVASAGVVSRSARVHHFHTRPDLRPPLIEVLRDGPTADGLLFLAPSSGPGERGVLILGRRGEVVYFHPTTPHTAMNFRTSRYRGKPVLTWWEGKTDRGLGEGTHVIVDDRYHVVARVPAGGGRHSDLHEFVITPRSTALVTSYEVREADLSALGGPAAGQVIGGIVQELALPSGRVLFEWRSLDHVAVDESHAAYAGHPLDYFHINSIDLTADGNLLVSARNTWAVYKVSRRTGDVLWRLGGRRSDFEMGPGTTFAWQHDARHHGPKHISIFDDGAAPQVEPESRVLVLELDGVRHRATLDRRYTHRPNKLVSQFMGNAQILPNGNVVVGWGNEPYVTEFGSDGAILFDAKLPHGGQNYRAFRFPWDGRPTTQPAIARPGGRYGRTVFVSWNGATDVVTWELLTRNVPEGPLVPAGRKPKRAFEEPIDVPAGVRYAAVAALDLHGRVLARTKTIRI